MMPIFTCCIFKRADRLQTMQAGDNSFLAALVEGCQVSRCFILQWFPGGTAQVANVHLRFLWKSAHIALAGYWLKECRRCPMAARLLTRNDRVRLRRTGVCDQIRTAFGRVIPNVPPVVFLVVRSMDISARSPAVDGSFGG